ncbi:permease [Nocardia mangyaensis]|uniref:permease n=1 Tax=Nocardia mangyaensis TaxID=2213200 RepID=UPI002676B7DC|nr:permease [Nocardia mangyaensis]MDO3649153.1 permease [Nocardia mangyaensis]
MTTGEAQSNGQKSTAIVWRNRAIITVATAVVLVIAYLILSSFIPRWWAQRLANMVHGSFTQGIWWGLVFGLVFTLVPLLLVVLAVRVWKRKGGKFIAGAAVIVALLTAVPNLMTLTIVLGGNNAAHAGQRILDVDAPAFRGACLVGAILAAVLFALVLALLGKRGLNRRSAAKAAAAPAPAPTPPPGTPPMTGER